MTFEFTQEQAQTLAMGLDSLLKSQGLGAVDAVQNVNAALQSQAKAQLEAAQKPMKEAVE